MIALTRRQAEILHFLETGPTQTQIAVRFGLQNIVAHQHLVALHKKGRVNIGPGGVGNIARVLLPVTAVERRKFGLVTPGRVEQLKRCLACNSARVGDGVCPRCRCEVAA